MSLTSLPVSVADLLQLQLGIQQFQNSTEATAEAAAINAGTTTVSAYANQLLTNNISFSQVAMAVDALMFGGTDNVTELTKLSTQYLPAQVANAVAHGYNPTVYAAEALGLALAGGNGTSNSFATNFGLLSVSAFAQAVGTATGVNVNAIQQFANNWINFYTANPAATFGLSVTLASYGAAFGDAVGIALLNPTTANLQTLVPNALIDMAEGKYVAGTSLSSQPTHDPLQSNDTILTSALTGPFVLNAPNGATLVAGGFGAGNDVTVHGSNGLTDAFTMTATSIEGQDWGKMTFSDLENVTLAFTAGVGGFDLDLGAITMSPSPGAGNTLNFTGSANVYVTVGLGPPFGTGAILLGGGGLINDSDSGVLHFGGTNAAKIVGTTGGGIIMQGIDTSPTGVQEFGSATGWNALAGSVLNDTFTGGTGNAGGEGDIFLTNGGADTINLAPGHSANHIELYGSDGTTTTAGGITVYNAIAGSITNATPKGLGQPGFWGNTATGATNDIFTAFTSSGTSATQVTINGFNVASDVIDLSVSAWGKVTWKGLLQLNGNDPPGGFPAPPASSAAGTPAVITSQLFAGASIVGAPAHADVILFGGNFPDASALGSSLHLNHFGLFTVGPNGGIGGNVILHEIGLYNDLSNNAHIVDIALMTTDEIDNNFFSDDAHLKVAISDMAVLVGINANSLTGANIHFVT